MTSVQAEPTAWLVIASTGFRAVFLDYARAIQYAAHTHGEIMELFLGDEDDAAAEGLP